MKKKTKGGVKFDNGKAPLSWIPRKILEEEANVFLYGSKKYARNNYKKGMEWSRVIDAALRHLYAFADGENFDKESKLHHLSHCKANLTMLMYYYFNNKGKDDRG